MSEPRDDRVGDARGADHGPHAVLQGGLDEGGAEGGVAEVDDHVGPRAREQRAGVSVQRVGAQVVGAALAGLSSITERLDNADGLEIGLGLDGGEHLAAHVAAAADGDANHGAPLP